MQMHDTMLNPIRFCGRVLKESEINYHPAEREVLALLHFLNLTHTVIAGRVIHVYNRFSTMERLFSSNEL